MSISSDIGSQVHLLGDGASTKPANRTARPAPRITQLLSDDRKQRSGDRLHAYIIPIERCHTLCAMPSALCPFCPQPEFIAPAMNLSTATCQESHSRS
jgi:hypothetical protein